MKIEFTWDPTKAQGNLKKHGIAFEDSVRAFADPHLVSDIESHVDGEDRWRTIAMLDGNIVVLVIHTITDLNDIEVIRIISARRADRKERRYYEESYGQI
jgi:uncharacterized protein